MSDETKNQQTHKLPLKGQKPPPPPADEKPQDIDRGKASGKGIFPEED